MSDVTDGTWYCQDCWAEGEYEEFLPTDGNPAPVVCFKCGRTDIFRKDEDDDDADDGEEGGAGGS